LVGDVEISLKNILHKIAEDKGFTIHEMEGDIDHIHIFASAKPKVALKLSDREWTCPQCNTTHDRDINAAKNIQQIGLEAPELTPVKKTTSVFSIKKIQADSVKQESHASV
ncbi:MAG: transposase, partial [Mariprofundaceae bacterium]|nr:transposase [Mariprofundaceae bacterium]